MAMPTFPSCSEKLSHGMIDTEKHIHATEKHIHSVLATEKHIHSDCLFLRILATEKHIHSMLDSRLLAPHHSLSVAVRMASKSGHIQPQLAKRLFRLAKAANRARHMHWYGLASLVSEVQSALAPTVYERIDDDDDDVDEVPVAQLSAEAPLLVPSAAVPSSPPSSPAAPALVVPSAAVHSSPPLLPETSLSVEPLSSLATSMSPPSSSMVLPSASVPVSSSPASETTTMTTSIATKPTCTQQSQTDLNLNEWLKEQHELMLQSSTKRIEQKLLEVIPPLQAQVLQFLEENAMLKLANDKLERQLQELLQQHPKKHKIDKQ